MKFILTSCGLSMLTNYLKSKYDIEPKEVYKRSNLRKDEIDKEFLEKVENAVKSLKHEIVRYSNKELKRLSAELNALISFYRGSFDNKDFHLLFVTDTYLGEVVADILKTFLEKKGINAQKLIAKDLKTSSLEEFEMALSDVVKELSGLFEDFKSNNYEIVFNLTGGYKSVNSFLQTMATLWADRSIYIFEGSSELLEIPKLPLRLDEEIFEKYFDVFVKLERGEKLNEEEIKNIPSALIIKIGDEYSLSSWGEIVWQKYKRDNFRFYSTEEVVKDIRIMKNVRNILKNKFPYNYSNKTEIKNGHYVYDDGNNPYRIFYFKEGSNFYIYKVFEDHDKYEKFLEKPFTEDFKKEFKKKAKIFGLKEI